GPCLDRAPKTAPTCRPSGSPATAAAAPASAPPAAPPAPPRTPSSRTRSSGTAGRRCGPRSPPAGAAAGGPHICTSARALGGRGPTRGARPAAPRPGGGTPPLARPAEGRTSRGLADAPHDEVAGGGVIELLAALPADAAPRPAATGAGLVPLGQVVLDPLAR